MKKKRIILFKVILIIFVFLGGIYLAKDRILSLIVPQMISRMLGAEVDVQNVSLSFSEQSLIVEGLKVFNPSGFPEQVMLDVPFIHANIDVDSLFKHRIYLPFLKINIEAVNIDYNSKQVSNIKTAFNIGSTRKGRASWSYQIDYLALIVGWIKVTKIKKTEKPDVSIHYIFDYRVYEDICDVKHLGDLLVVDAIKMAKIKDLTLMGVSSLSSSVISPIKKTGSFVGLGSMTDVVPKGTAKIANTLFLPYEAAETLVGGRTVKVKLAAPPDRIYQVILNVFEQHHGVIKKSDEEKGRIIAKVESIKIDVRLKAVPGGTELIVVSTERLSTKPHFSRALVYFLTLDLAKDNHTFSRKSLIMK